MVKQQMKNGKKLFFFMCGVLETLVTVGIIFGWTPLLDVLVSEGQYDELCPGGIGPCVEQSLQLNLIFTVTVSIFGASFLPAGLFLDKFGPRASRLVGSVIFTIGLILFGASDSKTFDAFIPAYLLIGLGCPPIFSSFFQWSSLFSRGTLFITMLNCAFDAGAIVFFIFQIIYKHGIKRSYIFYGYALLGVLIFLHSAIMPDPVKQERGKRRRRYAVEYFTGIELAGRSMPRKCDDFYTFREQLTSIYYILPTLCLVVVATMINFYVGTVSEQLARSHPPPSESTLNTFHILFNLVFPLGTILWVVPIGWMLSKYSMITSLFVGLTVGIAFGLVTCVTNLNVQFFAFVLLSLFRPLIYSILSTYITVVFGFRRFGTLYGIMNVINGAFSFGQYFLNYLVFNFFDGDFFRVNFGLTFLIAVMYTFPAFLKVRKRRHEETGQNSYLRVQGKIEKEMGREEERERERSNTSLSSMQSFHYGFEEERQEEEDSYVPPLPIPSMAPLPTSSPPFKRNNNNNNNNNNTSAYNPFEESSNPFDQPSSSSSPPPLLLSSAPPPSSSSPSPPLSFSINNKHEDLEEEEGFAIII